MAELKRQLKIKTGVVKRLVKEHACYIKEVEKEEVRIEKLKSQSDQNADHEYLVKKAGDVLQETRGMVGDTARRLATAIEELNVIISEGDFSGDLQELVDAQEQIAAGNAIATA